MKRFAAAAVSVLLAAGCFTAPVSADSSKVIQSAAGGGAAVSEAAQTTAPQSAVWDGVSVDTSWYFGHEDEDTYVLDSAADLAGAAALVNGLVNDDCVVYTGSGVYTAAEWNSSGYVNSDESSSDGSNNRSTSKYSWGITSFRDKTLELGADLDMSTGNYMPVGGQYRMNVDVPETHLGSSFCGTLDGCGHSVKIICDRHVSDGNFGDGQSVGLIGRLGVHDNDDESLRPDSPSVKNVAVYGKVYANRSVGGIVGKIGKTGYNSGNEGALGGVIENCANFADVSNTDAKGCGGIAGAGWNGGVIRNCYNAGDISSTYSCPTGGISGSNEIPLENCYSTGQISAMRDEYAMGIGTNNGGAPLTFITNCWYLEDSAPGGGYFSASETNEQLALTQSEMKSADFAGLLGDAFAEDRNNINGGYPILKWQADLEEAPFTNEDTGDDGDDEDCPSRIFSDVGDSSVWYHKAVDYVTARGYFSGTSASTFEPDGTMTRAMFVTVLCRMDGADQSQYSGSRYIDVPADQWYAPAVEWAAENGIVSGVSPDEFQPGASVTREQMAAFLYRYAQFRNVSVTAADSSSFDGFEDKDSVSGWAENAVIWASSAGIINGTGSGRIEPQMSSTRAQVAQVIMNYESAVSEQ